MSDIPENVRQAARLVREEWDAWLHDDEQQFPSDGFLNAIEELCTACGVPYEEEFPEATLKWSEGRSKLMVLTPEERACASLPPGPYIASLDAASRAVKEVPEDAHVDVGPERPEPAAIFIEGCNFGTPDNGDYRGSEYQVDLGTQTARITVTNDQTQEVLLDIDGLIMPAGVHLGIDNDAVSISGVDTEPVTAKTARTFAIEPFTFRDEAASCSTQGLKSAEGTDKNSKPSQDDVAYTFRDDPPRWETFRSPATPDIGRYPIGDAASVAQERRAKGLAQGFGLNDYNANIGPTYKGKPIDE